MRILRLFRRAAVFRILRRLALLILAVAAVYSVRFWKKAARKRQDSPALRNQELLAQALRESQETGRPILADCWATWCKNCAAMDAVLASPEVKKALEPYTVIRVQAEDIAALQRVPGCEGIKGLPAFLVAE